MKANVFLLCSHVIYIFVWWISTAFVLDYTYTHTLYILFMPFEVRLAIGYDTCWSLRIPSLLTYEVLPHLILSI